MIIKDFMDYNVDEGFQIVEIFDIDSDSTIYKGFCKDMPYKFKSFEIESWNGIADCGICFNVCLD